MNIGISVSARVTTALSGVGKSGRSPVNVTGDVTRARAPAANRRVTRVADHGNISSARARAHKLATSSSPHCFVASDDNAP